MKTFTLSRLLLMSGLGCCGAFVPLVVADPLPMSPDAVAVVHLTPAKDGKVTGEVEFFKTEKGVRVVAHVMNLGRGDHGIHIHEKADLSAPDLSSAGGHFNPTHTTHGAPDAQEHHAGDLGNLKPDSSGVANMDFIDPGLKLTGPDSIIGHSVIVHEKADDLKTQPAGDSGRRIAGGVIEPVKH